MSNANHTSTRKANLELYSFPILSPEEMMTFAGTFKEVLFGALSKNDRCEIHPVSGYISYAKSAANRAPAGAGGCNLPASKELALKAAMAFLNEKYQAFKRLADLQKQLSRNYNHSKPLKFPFAPIPNPEWLKPVEIYPVRGGRDKNAEHWLCKFEVQIPVGKSSVRLLHANIDVRIGGAPVAAFPSAYEVVGLVSRFRPMIYAPSQRLAAFLPDTGAPTQHSDHDEEAPAHGLHLTGKTSICYIQSDANSPQFKLLPYEVTPEGDHDLNILPGSTESLWVELNGAISDQEFILHALVMGGSGEYDAKWGFWNPIGAMSEEGELVHQPTTKPALIEHIPSFPGLAISEHRIPIGIWEVAFSVYDRQNHNVIHKVISLTVNPVRTSILA